MAKKKSSTKKSKSGSQTSIGPNESMADLKKDLDEEPPKPEEAKSENVRVVVRVRPSKESNPEIQDDGSSDSDNDEMAKHWGYKVKNDGSMEVKMVRSNRRVTKKFQLDQVFQEQATQEEIYKATAEPMIKSFVQGYHATIFAYGQTGSGKTFTMFGKEGKELMTGPDRGIIPRAAVDIFNELQRDRLIEQANIGVTLLEIYNDEFNDLLNVGKDVKLKLREDDEGQVKVEGLKKHYISSPTELCKLISKGLENRHVGATAMNSVSSRSHTVCTMLLKCRLKNGYTRESNFHLVDLAGCERLKKSQATGEMLKQAQQINKSLSALGVLIRALTEKNRAHRPFRDSKLTYYLKNSLGANSKTALIAAMAPEPRHASETVSTLEFAQRAQQVEGQVMKNEKLTDKKKWKRHKKRKGSDANYMDFAGTVIATPRMVEESSSEEEEEEELPKPVLWSPSKTDFHPFVTIGACAAMMLTFGLIYWAVVPLLVTGTNECNAFKLCNSADECLNGFCVQKEVLDMTLNYDSGLISFTNSVPTVFTYDGTAYSDVIVKKAGSSSQIFPKNTLRLNFRKSVPSTLFRCTHLRADYNDKTYMRYYLSMKAFNRMTTVAAPVGRYVRVRRNGENPPALFLAMQCNDEQWMETYKLEGRAYKPDVSGEVAAASIAINGGLCIYTDNQPTSGNFSLADWMQPMTGNAKPTGQEDPDLQSWIKGCLKTDYDRAVAIGTGAFKTSCMRDSFDMVNMAQYLTIRTLVQNIDDYKKNHVVVVGGSKISVQPNDWDLTFGCQATQTSTKCDTMTYNLTETTSIRLDLDSGDQWPCSNSYNRIMGVSYADVEVSSCVKEQVCAQTQPGTIWTSDMAALIDHTSAMLKPIVADEPYDDIASLSVFETEVNLVKEFLTRRGDELRTMLNCNVAPTTKCSLLEVDRTVGGFMIGAIFLGAAAMGVHAFLWWRPNEKVARVALLVWSLLTWGIVINSLVQLFFVRNTSNVGLSNPSSSSSSTTATAHGLFRQNMEKGTLEEIIFLVVLFITTLQVPMWTRMGFGAYYMRDPSKLQGMSSAMELTELPEKDGKKKTSTNDADTTDEEKSTNDDKPAEKAIDHVVHINGVEVAVEKPQQQAAPAAAAPAPLEKKKSKKLRKREEKELLMSKESIAKVHRMISAVVVFYWLGAIGYLVYVFAANNEDLKDDFTWPSTFIALISIMAMILLRAFWSALKWVWMWKIGITVDDMDTIYSARQAGWSLPYLLETYDERSMRICDAYPKKLVHMFDGIISFLGSMLAAGSVTKFEVSAAFTFGAILSMAQMVLYLATYTGDNSLSWLMYGSKARIMDGSLGRANELFGWLTDKLMLPVMIPLSLWMNQYFHNSEMFLVAVTIFAPIIVGDAFGEFIGAQWGKQTIKVCGVGETNRKSVAGTIAVFVSSIVILLVCYAPMQAKYDWYILAPVASAMATLTELYAPRSTDNVFMAVVGTVVCGVFGLATSR